MPVSMAVASSSRYLNDGASGSRVDVARQHSTEGWETQKRSRRKLRLLAPGPAAARLAECRTLSVSAARRVVHIAASGARRTEACATLNNGKRLLWATNATRPRWDDRVSSGRSRTVPSFGAKANRQERLAAWYCRPRLAPHRAATRPGGNVNPQWRNAQVRPRARQVVLAEIIRTRTAAGSGGPPQWWFMGSVP